MPSFPLDYHQQGVYDRYTGNVSFYQFSDSCRRPTFLQRNIATVLRHHRRQTTAAKSKSLDMATPVKTKASPGRAQVAREWDPKEILKIIDECKWSDQDPHLRIDIKAIKDRRKTFKLATPLTTPERPSKQARRETIRAICALTIWEGSGPEVLVQDQVRCSITPEPNRTTGERYAKVDLDEPLTVSPQSLRPKGQNGSTAIRYSMQITLQAASLKDKWPPLEMSNVPEPGMRHQKAADGSVDVFPLFVVSYSRLPHVPTKEDEALWAITALQDYRSYLPKLSLHVDARWVDTPTPLQYFNQTEKSKAKEHVQVRGPADATSERELPSNLNVETTWEISDDQLLAHEVEAHRFVGYVCPLCNNRSFQGTEIYWFHLIHSHDYFKFRITTRFPERDDEEGLIRVKVRMSLKDRRDKSPDKHWDKQAWDQNSKKDSKKETWVLKTHKTFLDLDRYLKADEERQWNGRSQRESHLGEPLRLRPPPDLTKPAHLVSDLPEPQRKKYAVPRGPDGVKFFSLRAKRPLKHGEALSESDDNIDDNWAVLKHMHRIDGFKAQTEEEKRFQKRHDKHMLKENINSNLHYRDALVRFCRKNRHWLQNPAMRFEFGKKLASLKFEGVIKVQQVFEYMQIVDAATGQAQSNEEEEDAADDKRPLRAQPGPLYAYCAACSDAIRSVRSMLRCTNPVCTNDYHTKCLKDTELPSTADVAAWRCPQCVEQSPWEVKVEGAEDSKAPPVDEPARPRPSPDVQILDNFAPDHLSSLPRGHGLGPGESSGRYRRSIGTAADPGSLAELRSQARVQDSEADSEDLRSTPDFPVGRDKMRLQNSAGKDSDDGDRARHAEYPGRAWEPEGHRHARYLDPTVKRTDEELRRRITDENYSEWMQKRRVTEGDSVSRPRRPHEL